jgi:hypothetical protein
MLRSFHGQLRWQLGLRVSKSLYLYTGLHETVLANLDAFVHFRNYYNSDIQLLPLNHVYHKGFDVYHMLVRVF